MDPATRIELDALPSQPGEDDWAFVDDLRTTPYHSKVNWSAREPADGEVCLADGVRLEPGFDEARGVLDTAYEDFRYYLSTVDLSGEGTYPICTCRAETSIREEYCVTVTPDSCKLSASDTEGVRRGLVWLEDEMLRRGGPFLPLGSFVRTPVIRTRISRCFYGPVNRPPRRRDELTDDVDYYPEEYLNRLAHEGVNALWFTVHFFQTVPSNIIPEYGRESTPRLDKLRRTVQKCARYGIRIYPFCIEPAAFTWPYAEVAAAGAAHPELRGHNGSFCTSTEKGQAYLQEATRTLFTEVPGLGGLIVIPVGERGTHCYSAAIPQGSHGAGPNTCPRCSQREPWEVLADTLDHLAQGMHSVNPEAELVAWPYGQFISWGAEKTAEAARHMPPGVILQHNFETGGHNRQLDKWRPAWDYWLSYVGPSDLFQECARGAIPRGTRVSAKLQVGCSHEAATTQVVPAPGLLYEKYRQMHELGVSGAMQSWYFGTYPSLMTKAAGELSFAPFPESQADFLLSLASRDWGRHAPEVARAWQCFQDGYSQYPTAHIFGYYGPMHDGPAWPLYLVPRRLPLSPTWQIGYPPSGDYIAECVTNGFTLDEMLTLCTRMADHWSEGVRILEGLRPCFQGDDDRMKDIGIASALGLQFTSGRNILEFYSLRESLADSAEPRERKALLGDMKAIVNAEMGISEELARLAEADSRLGFHSEAEGYKYFPELLRWRVKQLQLLLELEFPAVERQAAQGEPLFPEYTGEQPAGAAGECPFVESGPEPGIGLSDAAWGCVAPMECSHWLRQVFNEERWGKCGYDGHDHLPVPRDDRLERTTEWKSLCDREAVYVGVQCTAGTVESGGADPFVGNGIQVHIEPERTLPRMIFHASPNGAARCVKDDGYIPRDDDPWTFASSVDEAGWSMGWRIPLDWLGGGGMGARAIRVNVIRTMPIPGREGVASCSWAKREPVKGRLVWGVLNPATDFGWLRLEGHS